MVIWPEETWLGIRSSTLLPTEAVIYKGGTTSQEMTHSLLLTLTAARSIMPSCSNQMPFIFPQPCSPRWHALTKQTEGLAQGSSESLSKKNLHCLLELPFCSKENKVQIKPYRLLFHWGSFPPECVVPISASTPITFLILFQFHGEGIIILRQQRLAQLHSTLEPWR